MRPFRFAPDDGGTAEVERFLATDADRVAHRHTAGLDEIEPPLADVDDDRPRTIGAGEGDLLAQQARIDFREVEARDFVPVVVERPVGAGEGGVSKRIETGPAPGCAPPEQDGDSAENAAPVDMRFHC